jgi:pimeloyl-ACP methyl ester carboxylesterase
MYQTGLQEGGIMPETFGDLVVVIPGILGSKLARREGDRLDTVWDFSIRHLASSLKTLLSGRIVLDDNGTDPPDDGIAAVDLFSYQLLPGFFGVDDYAPLIRTLQRCIGKSQVISFPYDWRLSNRHAARKLDGMARNALNDWRVKSGNAGAKLWLVCHSMGGLVARYFCETLGGADVTRAVLTIGTPHRGSVRALDALVNGKHFGPIDATLLVRSLPSAYELLPLFPVLRKGSAGAFDMARVAELFGLDPFTGNDAAIRNEQGGSPDSPPLPGIDRAMLKRALEFHAAIRGPAEARAQAGEPSPYRLESFFNRRQPTPLSAWFDGRRLQVLGTYPEQRGGCWNEDDHRGDGTVPSFSAVPIEWQDTERAIALGEKHAALQASITLGDALFNWLRPIDVRGKKGIPDDAVVALDVPYTCREGDDLTVALAAKRPTNGYVDLFDVESEAVLTHPVRLSGEDSIRESVFRGVTAGVHRVTFRPADRRQPSISDYIFVVRE